MKLKTFCILTAIGALCATAVARAECLQRTAAPSTPQLSRMTAELGLGQLTAGASGPERISPCSSVKNEAACLQLPGQQCMWDGQCRASCPTVVNQAVCVQSVMCDWRYSKCVFSCVRHQTETSCLMDPLGCYWDTKVGPVPACRDNPCLYTSESACIANTSCQWIPSSSRCSPKN